VTTPVHLLLVEDSMTQARFMQHILQEASGPGFDVSWAESLGDALDHLSEAHVDLVLLDLVLPDSNGIATFEAVQRSHPDVPIIVLSGAGDHATAIQAVADGAQDYLAKSSMSPELLTRAIRYAVERHRNLRELRRLALRDDLTGVHNRRGFLVLADQQLALAQRGTSTITVLFVDVDGLKRINDTHGHRAGDDTLVEVAELMEQTFRASDVVGRLGGDEFCALLLDDGTQAADALPAGLRLQHAIDERNVLDRRFALSCSIGAVTRVAADGLSVADLLSQADDDMYAQRQRRRVDREATLRCSPHPGETLAS
jgi:two-component system cell cycle response regulator